MKAYSHEVGRPVQAQEVQGVLGLLTSGNLLMRVRHGHYGVTDPLVEQAWRGRMQNDRLLRSDAPDAPQG